MDSEEVQQEHVLPPGVGRSEAAHPDAAAVSSPTAAPTLKLTEDLALALLERRDLPPETLEQLGKDPAALRSRKGVLPLRLIRARRGIWRCGCFAIFTLAILCSLG